MKTQISEERSGRSLLQEFKELETRYREVVEVKDQIGSLISRCHAWMKEQKNFENDEFLKCMALALLSVCQEKIKKTTADIAKIEQEMQTLRVKVANRFSFYKTINNGGKLN